MEVIVTDSVDWKDVAHRLAIEVADLRQRLLGLATVLPPDFLVYLDAPFNAEAGTFEVLDGWNETAVVKSDVVTELNALWQRLS
jgi:hypothetical protein